MASDKKEVESDKIDEPIIQTNTNQLVSAELKNSRISATKIKEHIFKRYKKTLTSRIMAKLEPHIKEKNFINYTSYITILFNSLFEKTTYNLKNN